MEVPLAMEGFDSEEIEAIISVFKSGKLTMGEQVTKFEEEFAKYIGIKNAVMVNSGSSANLLAFESIVRGTQRINIQESYFALPAVLWPTTLWPIIQIGLKPLLIDSLPNSLEIDLDELVAAKAKYGDKLIGAIVIHPLGKSLDLNKLRFLREKLDLIIIEDNCESLGSGNDGAYSGTVGDFGTFSFYFSHHMTTVEGGMIVTNDDNVADDLRSMRSHGWSRPRTDKKSIESIYSHLNKDFLFVTSGFNFRPMEFQGVAGSIQLKKLPNFISRRIKNAEIINKALGASNLELIGSETLANDAQNSLHFAATSPVLNSWMALPIRVKNSKVSIQEIHEKLGQNGIATRPLLAGDFLDQPASQSIEISVWNELKNSRELYSNAFMIGNHHNFTDKQIEHVADILAGI